MLVMIYPSQKPNGKYRVGFLTISIWEKPDALINLFKIHSQQEAELSSCLYPICCPPYLIVKSHFPSTFFWRKRDWVSWSQNPLHVVGEDSIWNGHVLDLWHSVGYAQVFQAQWHRKK